jgi:hypothetical protein
LGEQGSHDYRITGFKVDWGCSYTRHARYALQGMKIMHFHNSVFSNLHDYSILVSRWTMMLENTASNKQKNVLVAKPRERKGTSRTKTKRSASSIC